MPQFEPPDDQVEKARKYSEGSPIGVALFAFGWALAIGGCTASVNYDGSDALVFALFVLAIAAIVGGRRLMLKGQEARAGKRKQRGRR